MEKEHVTCSVESLDAKSESISCDICSINFTKKSNLRAHLIKTHRIIESNADEAFYRKKRNKILTIYHCPMEKCKYHISTGKGVTKFSVLKQHYCWVHKPHHFVCSSCQKTFGTAAALKYHLKTCGQRFICEICNSDFADEKVLHCHQMRMHVKKVKVPIDGGLKQQIPSIQAQPAQLLQPICIPILMPMTISDPNLLQSLHETSNKNFDLLKKLNMLNTNVKDAQTQVDGAIDLGLLTSNYQPLMGDSGSLNCISYGWPPPPMDHNNNQFYSATNGRNMFLNSCHASMQTVQSMQSFDNPSYHVETQTNVGGLIKTDLDYVFRYPLNQQDMSFFTDAECMTQTVTADDEFLKLADSHTQTASIPLFDNIVDFIDIETQTNLQELDSLLFD